MQKITQEERSCGTVSNKNITLYTFEEAREILKCSKTKLRELLDTGELHGRNPRFFIKIGDPIPLQIHESCHSPRPMPKAVFVSADCGTAKEKSRTFLQRTALRV